MEPSAKPDESMANEDLIETLAEHEALLADGFEGALIGTVTGWFNREHRTVALYDIARCIQILCAEGLSEEEAEEYVEYNLLGAWVGGGTPAFAYLY